MAFNRLVLCAGLTGREITILRAYARYMRQVGFPFSQHYIEDTLSHQAITILAKVILSAYSWQAF